MRGFQDLPDDVLLGIGLMVFSISIIFIMYIFDRHNKK